MNQCWYASLIGITALYYSSLNNCAVADTDLAASTQLGSPPPRMQNFSSHFYENTLLILEDDCSNLENECIKQTKHIRFQLPTLDFLNDIAPETIPEQPSAHQWQSIQRIQLLKGVSDISSPLDPVTYREIWQQQKRQKSLPFSLIYYQFENPTIQYWENNIRLIPNQHGELESATEFELGWQLGHDLSLLSSLYTKWVAEAQDKRQSDRLFSLVLDYKSGNNDFQREWLRYEAVVTK